MPDVISTNTNANHIFGTSDGFVFISSPAAGTAGSGADDADARVEHRHHDRSPLGTIEVAMLEPPILNDEYDHGQRKDRTARLNLLLSITSTLFNVTW